MITRPIAVVPLGPNMVNYLENGIGADQSA